MLGIIIPTYNRPEHLLVLLEYFSSYQNNSWFELIILDNCSSFDVGDLVSGYSRRLAILLSIAEGNTGSMETNISRLGNISDFEVDRYSYLWVLGDDDLPIRESMDMLYYLLREKPASLIFASPLSRLSRQKPTHGEVYSFDGFDHYFRALVDCNIMDSSAGFTFVSNCIFSCNLFKKIYTRKDDGEMSAHPTNLSVLSAICEMDNAEEQALVMAVDRNLVKVAFKTLLRGTAVAVPTYISTFASNQLSEITSVATSYRALRLYTDTWLTIAPNMLRVADRKGSSTQWLYKHIEHYAHMIGAALEEIDEACHYEFEYHLFSSYLKRLCVLADSDKLHRLTLCIAQRKRYPVRFGVYSFGASGMFHPAIGWVKAISESYNSKG